ncbi:hypothetical protein RhiirA5_416310 [Rhizophagus irregularis]|uniref:Uncharacterized protein n=1 Tax=Rhizophagus irregularis TaxID=588596 RepID=A0A2N0PQ39_9GLOM|nr:hypothetical protein RhiirA5_416310 [Rhizophagus irregularis]
MMKLAPTWTEISSGVDTDIPDKKSAPTWIPKSKGNRLLLEYRIPKEISSNVDTDIPDKKSASNWIPESRRKISFKLDTGIPQELAPILIPILQEISFKIWISDFHELAPIWDTNPTRNRLQHGRQNLLSQVSDEFNIGILKVQNTKEIGSELANPIGKEIGSELANPIGKRNQLQFGYQNPTEKSAPICYPTGKSSPICRNK